MTTLISCFVFSSRLDSVAITRSTFLGSSLGIGDSSPFPSILHHPSAATRWWRGPGTVCAQKTKPETPLATWRRWTNTHWHLLYYDKIEFDNRGHFVSPPGDHHLSDALVFLVVGQNIVAARNRYRKWPADFDSTGDICPGRWPIGHPVVV